MAREVVHFEMSGPDPEALGRFYAELFGWTVTHVPEMDYRVIDTNGGGGINGGIFPAGEDAPSITFYVDDENPQSLLDRAEELGGSVVSPIVETPVVTFGRLADLDGLVVGVVTSADPGADVPGPSEGDGARVDWFEVVGTDGERTQRFYHDLFGWTWEMGGGYAHTTAGIGGGVGTVQAGGHTWVTVYAKVADAEAALARAEGLGGKRVWGPHEAGALVAGAFTDPAGNLFGVYTRAG